MSKALKVLLFVVAIWPSVMGQTSSLVVPGGSMEPNIRISAEIVVGKVIQVIPKPGSAH